MIDEPRYLRLGYDRSTVEYRQGRPIANGLKLAFWVNDNVKPLYADMETYLRFYVGDDEYRCYNPLRITAKVDRIVLYIQYYFRVTIGEIATKFEIVSTENK